MTWNTQRFVSMKAKIVQLQPLDQKKSVHGLARQTNSDFRAGKTQQQSFQSFCHSRSFVDGVDCHNIQHDGGVSHKIVKNAVDDKSRTKIFKFSVYGKIIQRLVKMLPFLPIVINFNKRNPLNSRNMDFWDVSQ